MKILNWSMDLGMALLLVFGLSSCATFQTLGREANIDLKAHKPSTPPVAPAVMTEEPQRGFAQQPEVPTATR